MNFFKKNKVTEIRKVVCSSERRACQGRRLKDLRE